MTSGPVVFLGPSLPLETAKRVLPHADFRPPIRRGDLDQLGAGAVVGIVDGVFDQQLAVSPGEIRAAIDRGATVFGAASMGALRATEVPAVTGLGRVHEMYASGVIDRDDEVALLFDPDTGRAMTEPLVNIRYAVDRLVRSATLPRSDGEAIVAASQKLHYTERTYPNVLRHSALAGNADEADVIRLLRGFDLKREDAQFLLETLGSLPAPTVVAAGSAAPAQGPALRVRQREDGEAPILIWESGDRVEFAELVRFLVMTGSYDAHARNAITRARLAGSLRTPTPLGGAGDDAAQGLLDATRLQWGWESPEEAHVTMRDLGLGLADVAESLYAEAALQRLVVDLARCPTDAFRKALRAELWMADLALKREALRLGALRHFAAAGAEGGPPDQDELDDARRCVTRLRDAMQWQFAEADLRERGLSDDDVQRLTDSLALARRAGWPLVEAMDGLAAPATVARAPRWRQLGLAMRDSPKARGSRRFSLSEAEAIACAERIAAQMGVVRIGMVGELSTLGIHVAQAFGERAGWSASFSSGKSETRDGARAGSIMEEAELHAQDAYRPAVVCHTSYAASAARLPLVDPRTLALPFDSRYTGTLEMDWAETIDLVGGEKVLVPTACLLGERLPNDIFYSPRLGGKIFSSSGLGSGFTLAEATVHAAAECIERHAQRMAEIELDNPGGVGLRRFWFIDERSLPETPRRIVGKYRAAGASVRILDMTSDIAVPTFYVRVFDDPFATPSSTSSDGFACHPDPEVALTMALLEAAQTKAGFIAGGREDYSLQARSLGRHERPRTAVASSQVFWFANDRPVRPFGDTHGYVVGDILSELEWIVQRVAGAGYPHLLVADYTMPRIAPAHAVRVLIPGSETTNPLSTGPRARATVIRDLLPRTGPMADRR